MGLNAWEVLGVLWLMSDWLGINATVCFLNVFSDHSTGRSDGYLVAFCGDFGGFFNGGRRAPALRMFRFSLKLSCDRRPRTLQRTTEKMKLGLASILFAAELCDQREAEKVDHVEKKYPNFLSIIFLSNNVNNVETVDSVFF